MSTISNQKFAFDLLISILATIILSTTILSISTNNWNINYDNLAINRTGLFQQCTSRLCCDIKELDRSITILALFSIILLTTSTLSAFLLMSIIINYKARCYILIPLTLFASGITMTLTLIQILDRIYINGYSAFIFIIDTILAYILGGVSLLHANIFYF